MTRRRRTHAGARTRTAEETAAIARARLQRLAGTEPSADVPESAAPAAAPSATEPQSPASRGLRSLSAGLADRLPPAVRAARLAPGGRALAGLAGVAVAGLVLGVALVWLARPSVQAAPPTPPRVTRVSASSPSVPQLVVHVAGAVRRPGLVELAGHARVADALAAAGGPARDAELASVNLARPVVDGEQIVVLTKGAAPAAGTFPGVAPGGGGPVDLNAATLAQLDGLPGVGPVLAQRIVDWRSAHGRFGSVDELREVTGIGAARFADLKARVRV
ncbi:MAG: competence protein ComEA [Actinomycetota bacterium]|nr:competence protein ComEA [Actinomycetota bacterium]